MKLFEILLHTVEIIFYAFAIIYIVRRWDK